MDLPAYAIEAKSLVKTYPAFRGAPSMQALKEIDLKIPRGAIFGLLGPNGAGKSTFINILAGLTKKTSGAVTIWGRDIDADPRNARAAIGVVPQEIAADVFFTPRESLDVQAGMYGVPRRERITGELAISFRTHEASVEEVLAAARAAGVHIRDLRTEEPDLEDVFLALTYGADALSPG